MNKISKKRAFTIVELVIVIAVIAILASVLIPSFSKIIERAKDSKLVQEAKNAYIQYMISHATDGDLAEHMIYKADEKYVAIKDGSAIGVYDKWEEALSALFDDPDDAKDHNVEEPDTDGLIPLQKISADNDDDGVLRLRYDDHYDVTGMAVQIVDKGTPKSYQVGRDVKAGTPDTAVLTLSKDQNTLIATGVGTAEVEIDGVLYEVEVIPAPLSVFLLLGDENMVGEKGDQNKSIVIADGQVYSTYAPEEELNEFNAKEFVPSALTGENSKKSSTGGSDYLSSWPVNLFTESQEGKKGIDSGIAYQWNKMTGDKVWTINTAHSNSKISTWRQDEDNYNYIKAILEAVEKTLQNEIAAGHYTLQNYGYFWYQGTRDATKDYAKVYLSLHEELKDLCTLDHDGDKTTAEIGLQFAGIIPILESTSAREAQFNMGNNSELTDIYLVWDDTGLWESMPDGTSGVKHYFETHYADGRVNYPVQNEEDDKWRAPTLTNSIHDNTYYKQIGYNEVGIRAAEKMANILSRAQSAK